MDIATSGHCVSTAEESCVFIGRSPSQKIPTDGGYFEEPESEDDLSGPDEAGPSFGPAVGPGDGPVVGPGDGPAVGPGLGPAAVSICVVTGASSSARTPESSFFFAQAPKITDATQSIWAAPATTRLAIIVVSFSVMLRCEKSVRR